MVAGTIGAVVGAAAAMGGNAVGNLTHREPPAPIVQQAPPVVRPTFNTSPRIDPTLTSAPVSVSTPNTTSQGGTAGGATAAGGTNVFAPVYCPIYAVGKDQHELLSIGEISVPVKPQVNAPQKTSSTFRNTTDQRAQMPIDIRQRRTEKTEHMPPQAIPAQEKLFQRGSPLQYIAAATTLLITAALMATKKLSSIGSSLKNAPLSCLALPIATRNIQNNTTELISVLQGAVGQFDSQHELLEYVDQKIEQERSQLSGYLHFVVWGYYIPLVSSVEVRNLEDEIRERLAHLKQLQKTVHCISPTQEDATTAES
jgi:hypothetical protein